MRINETRDETRDERRETRREARRQETRREKDEPGLDDRGLDARDELSSTTGDMTRQEKTKRE